MIDERAYVDLISLIKKKRTKGISFDEIHQMESDELFFLNQIKYHDWPEESRDVWCSVVDYVKSEESRIKAIQENTARGMIVDKGQINRLNVPLDETSCWQLYRSKLVDRNYKNVDVIENECINILNHLSTETDPESPVKGMVVGYVQSGKTANMAGLISMAADYGWNLFIILSGTIENLRIQTRDRLYGDLQNGERGNYAWRPVDHLSPDNVDANFFNPNDKTLNVCLKNPRRLEKLLDWINADLERKSKLKILLIDDEADQASINTAKVNEKRKRINNLIVNIVNCNNSNGELYGRYGSMNYVSYTATPYANFLSENFTESLYPRDFIILLTPSKEHFGPKIIYGDGKDYSGLDIIDTSSDVDREAAAYIKNQSNPIPSGLKDAVAWFITSVSVMRYREVAKPVSMLVHTTQYVEGHRIIAECIRNILEDHADLIVRCERVYSEKTSEFTKEKFLKQFHDYGRSSEEIADYPAYSEIRKEVEKLINMPPQHINIDDNNRIYYKRCIHLCVDNGDRTDICESDDDERTMLRIVYPNKRNSPDYATAFIVVGGNTLSRGLTIEGLVSTYFGRTSSSGDTLMQMGRWFGYRRDYELLPRIWMSRESRRSFDMIVEVDESLRDFIRENYNKFTPKDVPPMIRLFPKTGHLVSMTSSSKMINARKTNFNFSGCIFQTNVFDRDPNILEHNLNIATKFISEYSDRIEKSKVSYSKVIRNIHSEDICDKLISNLVYNDRLKQFRELDALVDWIKSNANYEWNVVLGSVKDTTSGEWKPCSGVSINKIARTPKRDMGSEDSIPISKTLASPEDRFSDVDPDLFCSKEYTYSELKKKNSVSAIREYCGMIDVPLLILYCISKESLGIECDAIGIVIQMPGVKNTNSKATHVQLPPISE